MKDSGQLHVHFIYLMNDGKKGSYRTQHISNVPVVRFDNDGAYQY